jgi:acetyl esterase/lipase
MMWQNSMRHILAPVVFSIALAGVATPQPLPSANWSTNFANQYQLVPNVTYVTAGGIEVKMDIYRRRAETAGVQLSPQPTVVFMHGGFWAAGAKETSIFALMPWMEMGFNVVNVEYRLARQAVAPAAVEDCFCALRFLNAQKQTYNIDVTKIIVTGESAGGHLALSMGILPESTDLARECAGAVDVPKPVAVVNFYGVTDVTDVIDGPHRANAAMQWFGGMDLATRTALAKRVSPMTYVRQGLPPILTIHGDADTTVPYQHAVNLHAALAKAGAVNQLLTIPGGKHGGFTSAERAMIFGTVREFLAKNGVTAK